MEGQYATWLISSAFTIYGEATPGTCALIHTAGYGNVMKGRVGKAKREFAERVVNCYKEDSGR